MNYETCTVVVPRETVTGTHQYSASLRDARAEMNIRHVATRVVKFTVAVVLSTISASAALTTPSSASNLPVVRAVSPVGTKIGEHSCPWVLASRLNRASPQTLANEVLSKMTLAQKAGFVTLSHGDGIENLNAGVPSLCIPPLTLSDGPDGLAGRMSGVSRLPAAIGLAASFNPVLAWETGRVLGAEARTKGIDVVQAPELNLARLPWSGRIFEGFGEDPYLTSVLGVAEITGIQSLGVMALAKHFTAYTQETNRARLNQIVPLRALVELYNVPFVAAIRQAHVAAIMCSVGSLNGVSSCADPYVFSTLRSLGFQGFVRSDLRAAPHPARAFRAGLDLIKPLRAATIIRLVRSEALPVRSLNDAVKAVLREMFAFGVIAHPRPITAQIDAVTPAHTNVALTVAQQSIVLLKNTGAILPLSHTVSSIAIIGTDASSQTVNTGGGSSRVTAPFFVSPLEALRSALGAHVRITFAPGTPITTTLHRLSAPGIFRGTTLTTLSSSSRLNLISVARPSRVTNAVATADRPGDGPGWSHWRTTLHVRTTGTYVITVRQIGDTWLYLDGAPIITSPGLHVPINSSVAVKLRGHQDYRISATWFSILRHSPPKFAVANVTTLLHHAANVARRAKVAIVFVGAPSTEGADRTSLQLPGAENALVSAVAAANPHTIVVLNTGGPVTMPWLKHVKAVIEAWYPGELDGTAITSVLDGAVDPSGRLPVTFPTSQSQQPITTFRQFPGVDSTVSFGAGAAALDIGYRWYQAHAVTPLFPFGFGLDYTTFRLSHASARMTPTGASVVVTVSNTGPRYGADVVQAYITYPGAAGEPPHQLRGFARVSLAPYASRRVVLPIASSGFESFVSGTMTVVPGAYGIDVGQSSANLPIHLHVTLR